MNLQLAVGPVRPDGFHELVTVFHAISLYDEVTVSEADRRRVTVTGESADTVPHGDDNLAVQAVTALARAVGLPPRQVPRVVSEASSPPAAAGPGVAIEIRKRIPVAAGPWEDRCFRQGSLPAGEGGCSARSSGPTGSGWASPRRSWPALPA